MSEIPKPLQPHPRARRIGLVLAGIKTVLVVLFTFAMAIGGGGSDPAGQAYLYGGFVLGGGYWLLFVLPALLLLRWDTGRRVGLAFALLLLPDLVGAFVLATTPM